MKAKNGRKKGDYSHKAWAIVDKKGVIVDYMPGASKRIYSRKVDASIRCSFQAGERVVRILIKFDE